MSHGCMQNWDPALVSSSHMEGASVLPYVRMVVHDLPARKQESSFVFHTEEAPVEFLFCLSGKVCITASDRSNRRLAAEISGGNSGILCMPRCRGNFLVAPHVPAQLVSLQIFPEDLNHIAETTGCPLHPALRKAVQGMPEPFFMESGRLSLPIRIVAEHIVTNTTDNAMRTIFMEYKKIELLYLHLNLLETDVIRLHSAKPQNQRIAYAARDILMRNFDNPPALDELARQVGLNRSQLNALFRRVFGDTVFGMVRKARLECARKMLEDGNRTVTEVAYECGFSSPSHFTGSFSKHFGTTPKQYQSEFNVRREAVETAKFKESA